MPKEDPLARNETGQQVGKGGAYLSVGITRSQKARLLELKRRGLNPSVLIRAAIEEMLAKTYDMPDSPKWNKED